MRIEIEYFESTPARHTRHFHKELSSLALISTAFFFRLSLPFNILSIVFERCRWVRSRFELWESSQEFLVLEMNIKYEESPKRRERAMMKVKSSQNWPSIIRKKKYNAVWFCWSKTINSYRYQATASKSHKNQSIF